MAHEVYSSGHSHQCDKKDRSDEGWHLSFLGSYFIDLIRIRCQQYAASVFV